MVVVVALPGLPCLQSEQKRAQLRCQHSAWVLLGPGPVASLEHWAHLLALELRRLINLYLVLGSINDQPGGVQALEQTQSDT